MRRYRCSRDGIPLQLYVIVRPYALLEDRLFGRTPRCNVDPGIENVFYFFFQEN